VPIEFNIDENAAGRTLADIVRSHWPAACSWNQAREACRRGKVRRNGQIETDAAVRLALGDRIHIDLQAPRLREHVLPQSALIYVDPHIAIVNKPPDLLSVPFETGDKNTLVDRLRALLRRLHGPNATELGVVHRLDKDTTGLMVFTRSLAAKRQLQQAFRVHAIERRYLAIAHGSVSEQRFDTQLIRDRGDGLRGSIGVFRRATGPVPREAQRAITAVRPLETLRGATLVECQLSTGRQHQIRIHMSEAGYPLLGEQVYIRGYKDKLLHAPRIMLHAAVLGLTHPIHRKPMRFEQPAPEDFEEVVSDLRST